MSLTKAESEKYARRCCVGRVQPQISSPPILGEPHSNVPDDDPGPPLELPWSPGRKEFAESSVQAAGDDKGEVSDDVESSSVPPTEVDSRDDQTNTSFGRLSEAPRHFVNESPTELVRDSNYDTQSTLEKYFGYPSEVVDFHGTPKFVANVSAFEILPRHSRAEWKLRQPIPGQTFCVCVSETFSRNLWERYRLLEINASDGTSTESACAFFPYLYTVRNWYSYSQFVGIPLRTLRVKLQDLEIELAWSDCNHQIKRKSGKSLPFSFRIN